MRVNIYANPVNYRVATIRDPQRYSIGCEDGAYFAYQNGLRLDRAMGDFDTLDPLKLSELENAGIAIEKVPAEKDMTDTAMAIAHALALGATHIDVYGGLGDRFDHSYANVLLCAQAPVTFHTASQKVFVLAPGVHTLSEACDAVSFFALTAVRGLSLQGFKYELEDYDLDPFDPLAVSNEGQGTVRFETGLLAVMMTF
jgi:thiamine pyrophosphokinase